jgi:hypothetical protein
MVREYWKRALGWAIRATRHALLQGAVAAVVITSVSMALYWWGFGWKEAIDQLIGALIGAGAFAATFVLFLIRNLVRAPAEMECEVRDEHAKVTAALESKIQTLEGDLSQRPEPEFELIRCDDLTCIEIRNHNCDAEFIVKIDFSRSNTHLLPRVPAFAQWVDMLGAEQKLIQDGGYDRFVLLGTELAHHVYTKTNFFLWVNHGTPQRRRSNSWLITKDSGSIPPSGEIEVIVSSQPPMRGGSRVLRFAFEADEIRAIDDES